MSRPLPDSLQPEGLRARKRRQTRQRIVEAGLELFLRHGFEATTLDAIAEAAEISRRTFFHYFDSKEAILQELESEAEQGFRAAFDASRPGLAPIEAIREALLIMIAGYGTEEAIAIDRLLRSTEALRARKQANYARKEQALFAVLAERWPDPARRTALRAAAMAGIGAMRLAAEAWAAEDGRRPLKDYLAETFDSLRGEFCPIVAGRR